MDPRKKEALSLLEDFLPEIMQQLFFYLPPEAMLLLARTSTKLRQDVLSNDDDWKQKRKRSFEHCLISSKEELPPASFAAYENFNYFWRMSHVRHRGLSAPAIRLRLLLVNGDANTASYRALALSLVEKITFSDLTWNVGRVKRVKESINENEMDSLIVLARETDDQGLLDAFYDRIKSHYRENGNGLTVTTEYRSIFSWFFLCRQPSGELILLLQSELASELASGHLNAYGQPPLSLAVENGDVTAVLLLLEAGASVKHDTFSRAIFLQDIPIATLLFDKEKPAAPDMKKLLHEMARRGLFESFVFLWSKASMYEIDINDTYDDHEKTLLLAACSTSSCAAPLVQFLLEQGADITIETRNGFTAPMQVAFSGNLDVVDVFLKKYPSLLKDANEIRKLLCSAINGGNDSKVVQAVLSHSAAFDGVLENGELLLSYHLKKQLSVPHLFGHQLKVRQEITRLLVHLGDTTINAIDERDGTTPFFWALVVKDQYAIDLLLRQPTIILTTCLTQSLQLLPTGEFIAGDTLLHVAARMGNSALVTLLMEKNPDSVSIENSEGKCAADVATDDVAGLFVSAAPRPPFT